MMKVLTHNIQQEREDQRDRSAQLFMWCIVVSMHQDDGIGASRLLRACNEMDAFEKKYQTAILYGSSKNATDAMRENLKGICDFEVRLPVDRAPRGRREEQLRMASNQGAEIAWLVMAATCHETFGYGRDRLHPHYEAKTMQWFRSSGIAPESTLFWITGAEPRSPGQS